VAQVAPKPALRSAATIEVNDVYERKRVKQSLYHSVIKKSDGDLLLPFIVLESVSGMKNAEIIDILNISLLEI